MQKGVIQARLAAVMLRCLRPLPCLGLTAALLGLAPLTVAVESDTACKTIAAIEVRGNTRMTADAVRFDLAIRKGDNWDDAKVRQEFRRFWDKGYFADLRFYRRCTAEGAVLVVEIKERPTILSISYEKNKVVSQQQVEDHFREREFAMSLGAPVDRKKLWRAESLIAELLGSKGFLDAQVHAQLTETSPTSRAVFFSIKPGGKTRISAIRFTGNTAFSQRRLRSTLKLSQPRHWYWPFGAKSLYHPLKFSQDVNNILELYRNRGYLDADVKPPISDFKSRRLVRAEARAQRRSEREVRRRQRERERAIARGEVPEREPPAATEPAGPVEKKTVALTVPVVEGKVYSLGEVRFEGNTVYTAEELRRYVPLRDGATLSDGALEFGLDGVRAAYGRKGYVYAAVTRRFERKEDKPVADVVIEVDEDQAYSVRRVDFVGNLLTQDEVLRRELKVEEGELIDKRELNTSMQKLRQLGFWQPNGEPELEPVTGSAQVDVKIHGEEQSRNEIQVGGGYSELDGGFFLASYGTRNFLGRGDSLDLNVQVGGRANRSSISFTEPWFLGKPYIFSFSIFRRELDYGRTTDSSGTLGRLQQRSTGGAISLGKRLTDFMNAQLEFRYQSIKADTFDISNVFDQTTTRLVTVTPSLWYRSVNDFYRPTRGFDFRVSPQISTAALGGDVSYVRPRVEVSWYHPFIGRTFVASHGEVAWIRPFGDYQRRAGYVGGVPRFDRFYLGGDTLGPRVFETRAISPVGFRAQVDQDGNLIGQPLEVFLGGSKMALGQFELGIPVGKTATFAGFLDMGGVYAEGENFNWSQARVSGGFEFRVFLPVFQAPIRLIYGWPLRKLDRDRINNFQFSIGLPF